MICEDLRQILKPDLQSAGAALPLEEVSQHEGNANTFYGAVHDLIRAEDEPKSPLPRAVHISVSDGVEFVSDDVIDLTISSPKVLRMLADLIEMGKLD